MPRCSTPTASNAVRSPEKLFGVFDCDVLSAHPLMTKVPGALAACRIRATTICRSRRSPLAATGFSPAPPPRASTCFAGPERDAHSLFVFLQGHPEYEAGTLLREYRRDIGRYLRGEWERYPSMPEGYFNGEASALLGAFRERALGERRQELIADFPMRALEAAAELPLAAFGRRVL